MRIRAPNGKPGWSNHGFLLATQISMRTYCYLAEMRLCIVGSGCQTVSNFTMLRTEALRSCRKPKKQPRSHQNHTIASMLIDGNCICDRNITMQGIPLVSNEQCRHFGRLRCAGNCVCVCVCYYLAVGDSVAIQF